MSYKIVYYTLEVYNILHNKNLNRLIFVEIGVLDIVRPFCLVVINEETTGPITGLAIGALDKFLASGLLGGPRRITLCNLVLVFISY